MLRPRRRPEQEEVIVSGLDTDYSRGWKMTYKTADNNRCIMRFKGWHSHGDLGHQGHTAEYTDQRPKRNQDITHRLGWPVPIAQHIGDEFGTAVPSWSRDERVNEMVNIDMPTPGITEGHRSMSSLSHDEKRERPAQSSSRSNVRKGNAESQEAKKPREIYTTTNTKKSTTDGTSEGMQRGGMK